MSLVRELLFYASVCAAIGITYAYGNNSVVRVDMTIRQPDGRSLHHVGTVNAMRYTGNVLTLDYTTERVFSCGWEP